MKEFTKSVKDRIFPGVLEVHLGASGVYKMWDEMLEKMMENWKHNSENGNDKLIVIGEFREEMGSFRSKVAGLLNKEFKKKLDTKVGDMAKTKAEKETEKEGFSKLRCFTSDIGMAIHFEHPQKTVNDSKLTEGETKRIKVKIQCSSCRYDNDLFTLKMDSKGVGGISFDPKSTFHKAEDMKEVCIKGDSEAMVYLCKEHIAKPKGLFIEHSDRYDLFNSDGYPL